MQPCRVRTKLVACLMAAAFGGSLAIACSGTVAPRPDDAPQREASAGPISGQVAIPGSLSSATALVESGAPLVGSLSVARSFFSATLLNDGRVLVAGGQDTDNLSLKSSEIYDPAAGKWSPTGEMTNARKNHRATLLQDGRVLVTGGLDVGEGVLRSQTGKGVVSLAEIYDPAAGVWESIADMNEARTLHQAVLLQDGRVLVIGGGDADYEPIASAEIYDASIGTWTVTGDMLKARQEHTATVLSDGRVLVTGGGRINATETTEIYDPSTGAWSEAGEMITGRISGVAARLNDGRVLIVGGREAYQWQEGSVLTAEIYDPVTKSWSAGANVVEFRHDTAVSILSDGRVMVVAGAMSEGMGILVLQTAEIYDPSTKVWTATAELAQARTGHSSTVLSDGKVLVVGGNTAGGTPISTVEMYDPTTGTWSFAAATP